MLYLAWNINVMRISMLRSYTTESSDRAFEEEVMLSGFAQAQTKSEGAGVVFDNAQRNLHC
jgi:hypothetical protein